jgi:hypothetical protein
MKYFYCLVILIFAFGCKGKNIAEDFRAMIPAAQSAKIVQTRNLPGEKMRILQYEVSAEETTEEEIIGFYKDRFAEKGWKLMEMQNYAGNGSVFSFADESAEVSIQTITRGIKDQGKLKVIINLSQLSR